MKEIEEGGGNYLIFKWELIFIWELNELEKEGVCSLGILELAKDNQK